MFSITAEFFFTAPSALAVMTSHTIPIIREMNIAMTVNSPLYCEREKIPESVTIP